MVEIESTSENGHKYESSMRSYTFRFWHDDRKCSQSSSYLVRTSLRPARTVQVAKVSFLFHSTPLMRLQWVKRRSGRRYLHESGCESKRVSVRTWYRFVCIYTWIYFNEDIFNFDIAHIYGSNRRCLSSPEKTLTCLFSWVRYSFESLCGLLPDVLQRYRTFTEGEMSFQGISVEESGEAGRRRRPALMILGQVWLKSRGRGTVPLMARPISSSIMVWSPGGFSTWVSAVVRPPANVSSSDWSVLRPNSLCHHGTLSGRRGKGMSVISTLPFFTFDNQSWFFWFWKLFLFLKTSDKISSLLLGDFLTVVSHYLFRQWQSLLIFFNFSYTKVVRRPVGNRPARKYILRATCKLALSFGPTLA